MNKILFILLLIVPLIGFGQNQESSDDKNMFHVSDVLFYDPCKYDTLVFLKRII